MEELLKNQLTFSPYQSHSPDQIIRAIDKNGDGCIQLHEFAIAFANNDSVGTETEATSSGEASIVAVDEVTSHWEHRLKMQMLRMFYRQKSCLVHAFQLQDEIFEELSHNVQKQNKREVQKLVFLADVTFWMLAVGILSVKILLDHLLSEVTGLSIGITLTIKKEVNGELKSTFISGGVTNKDVQLLLM